MVLFLSLLCAVTCLWAIIWKKIQIKKCTEPIEAEFVGFSGYSGKVSSPIVTFGFFFIYSYQGTDYFGDQSVNTISTITFNRSKFVNKLGYQNGNKYTIYINPENPKKYITKDRDSNLVLWFGLVFFVFLAYLARDYK